MRPAQLAAASAALATLAAVVYLGGCTLSLGSRDDPHASRAEHHHARAANHTRITGPLMGRAPRASRNSTRITGPLMGRAPRASRNSTQEMRTKTTNDCFEGDESSRMPPKEYGHISEEECRQWCDAHQPTQHMAEECCEYVKYKQDAQVEDCRWTGRINLVR